jgi:hypothetical protein
MHMGSLMGIRLPSATPTVSGLRNAVLQPHFLRQESLPLPMARCQLAMQLQSAFSEPRQSRPQQLSYATSLNEHTLHIR